MAAHAQKRQSAHACGALTPPHSSIKHRGLGSTSFRMPTMKRRYEDQIAMLAQPVLADCIRTEG